jgi:hypothetical protein
VNANKGIEDNVKIIIGVAKLMGVGQRGALIALMAGLTESGLQIDDNPAVPISQQYPNIQNHPAGDHNSVGIWQMQPDLGWNTFASGQAALSDKDAVFQDMNPGSAAEIFFGVPASANLPGNLAHPEALRSPGHRLQTISGWQTKDPAAIAQQIEGSAYPDRYVKQQSKAQALVDQFWDSSPVYNFASDPLFVPLDGSGKGTTPGTDTRSCGAGGGTVNCASSTGSQKILCAAERYGGIWYQFGGGHEPVDTYRKQCPDPTKPPNNQPHGAIGGDGSDGNPSPCAVDCSSLVSLAVDDAFGQKFMWNVADIVSGNPNWKRVSLSQAQPGDVATISSEHVEIFVRYDAKKDKVYTFGAHQTGTQTGGSSAGSGYYDSFWHYVGPGA